MRTAVSLLLLALSAASALAQSSYAVPRLKAQVVVAGDIVRVGDMIENAGLAADKPIFRAPDLGQTGSVPARAVLDAVRPLGLIAVDARGILEVSVTHQSRVVAAGDIEGRIVATLAARHNLGKGDNLKLTFDREVRPIELTMANGEPTLARFSYDPYSRRFDATFELPGNARAQWRYTGTAVETIEAAVVTRALQRGEVIKAGDVVIERRPKNEFTTEAPAPADAVIGQAARRVVRAGQPLRGNDLMKPELVLKNETVMIYYEVPGIVLTVRGKALESGAAGDTVNVLNINSKRTIQGTVTGPGRVTVTGPTAAVPSSHPRLAAASPSE